ncbi:hypothetical protein GCM10007904_00850 [Oharaeibacter diazotrophicus]|nr:hypothetical protein GCM10007904_00850 [Oharaeibacter diazotrophicus]
MIIINEFIDSNSQLHDCELVNCSYLLASREISIVIRIPNEDGYTLSGKVVRVVARNVDGIFLDMDYSENYYISFVECKVKWSPMREKVYIISVYLSEGGGMLTRVAPALNFLSKDIEIEIEP